jgi:hypothetical protein
MPIDERLDTMTRAAVWRAPVVPMARAALGADAATPHAIDCTFKLTDLGGTTPKFHCLLQAGVEIRAKYGQGEELPAEAAATRLLKALGFGADTVTLVERLRCYGCPREPFTMMKVVEATRTQHVLERFIERDSYQEFRWVAVEQKFDAPAIESADQEGWGFYELDRIDPAREGAPREQVDALRLLAVFLAHWDNKAENQRMVCLSKGWHPGTRCREPFLLLQDVGSTFGPTRMDLGGWERAPIWDDRATCRTSMRTLPYHGGTFAPVQISDRGRRFLAALLGALSDAQMTDLFEGARFEQHRGLLTESSPVSEWVRVFKTRVRAIADGPPCPS